MTAMGSGARLRESSTLAEAEPPAPVKRTVATGDFIIPKRVEEVGVD